MEFSARLIAWQREHGRHDLPWQGANAYEVWLSEIMLQQTQVATVIPYYERFLISFPTIGALAAASEEQVLTHWSGLGYYARGRNLHRAAQIVAEKYQGEFPQQYEQILALPGIGRSTAAAICALALHQRRAILDGNVKRVLARYCGVTGGTGDKQVEAHLWGLAEQLLPQSDVASYIQAQMDMGATLCTRTKPKCELCPVNADCVAFKDRLVNELPTPRPRKTVPEKHAIFLLMMYGHDILLEKRPGVGIWGGLWCLPQLDMERGAVDNYLQRNAVQVRESKELDKFTHTFTHFKLHITPVLLHLEKPAQQMRQSVNIWLNLEDATRAAIPTPVRKILKMLRAS